MQLTFRGSQLAVLRRWKGTLRTFQPHISLNKNFSSESFSAQRNIHSKVAFRWLKTLSVSMVTSDAEKYCMIYSFYLEESAGFDIIYIICREECLNSNKIAQPCLISCIFIAFFCYHLTFPEELLNNFAQQIGAWRFCLYFLSSTRNDYVMMYSLTVFEVSCQ